MRPVTRLARNEKGIAAVEFAVVAPVLVLILTGFMEYAWVFSVRSNLESVTVRAARAIAASDCPANRPGIMRNIIENGMRGYKSADGRPPQIETRAYGNMFGDVGEPEPFVDENQNNKYDAGEPFTDVNQNTVWDADMGRTGSIGAAGQVVSYTVRYQVASLFPMIGGAFRQTGLYNLTATTVVRNEPVFRNTAC